MSKLASFAVLGLYGPPPATSTWLLNARALFDAPPGEFDSGSLSDPGASGPITLLPSDATTIG